MAAVAVDIPIDMSDDMPDLARCIHIFPLPLHLSPFRLKLPFRSLVKPRPRLSPALLLFSLAAFQPRGSAWSLSGPGFLRKMSTSMFCLGIRYAYGNPFENHHLSPVE